MPLKAFFVVCYVYRPQLINKLHVVFGPCTKFSLSEILCEIEVMNASSCVMIDVIDEGPRLRLVKTTSSSYLHRLTNSDFLAQMNVPDDLSNCILKKKKKRRIDLNSIFSKPNKRTNMMKIYSQYHLGIYITFCCV